MYTLLYKKSVEKDLRKLPNNIRLTIIEKIKSLSVDPVPQGSTKLKGQEALYRIRHSNYRVIYEIVNNKLVIIVIKVAHRKEVYRDF